MTYRDDTAALRARIETLDAELEAETKKRIAAEASERAARAAVAEERAKGNRPPPNSRLPWVVGGICCAILTALLVGQYRTSARALAEQTQRHKSLEENLHKELDDCKGRLDDCRQPTKSPPPGQSLSRQQIQRGMRKVKHLVQQCYDKDRAPGLANVQLKISRDGRVSSARIKGVFSGTPTGECVLQAVRKAQFPRFTREPITITYPFVLR